MVDRRSMKFDDTWHRPIATPRWWGIALAGETSSPRKVVFPETGIHTHNIPWERDRVSGMVIRAAAAKVLPRYDNVALAITSNRHGTGTVYYLAGNLPIDALKRFFAWLYQEHNIQPHFVTQPCSATVLVETQRFGRNGIRVSRNYWFNEPYYPTLHPGGGHPVFTG